MYCEFGYKPLHKNNFLYSQTKKPCKGQYDTIHLLNCSIEVWC